MPRPCLPPPACWPRSPVSRVSCLPCAHREATQWLLCDTTKFRRIWRHYRFLGATQANILTITRKERDIPTAGRSDTPSNSLFDLPCFLAASLPFTYGHSKEGGISSLLCPKNRKPKSKNRKSSRER